MAHQSGKKARTRMKILESASRVFAAKGFEAGSIDEVMLECGLTRGGFYSHFRSKAHLYQEAMDTLESVGSWPDALFDAYQMAPHVADWHVLAFDAASSHPVVRQRYTHAVEGLLERMRQYYGHEAENDGAVIAAAAMAVGSIVIAQSISDRQLSARIARTCERAIRARHIAASIDLQATAFPWASETYLQAVGNARGEASEADIQPHLLFWAPMSRAVQHTG